MKGTIAFLYFGYLSPNSCLYLLCFSLAQISIYPKLNKVNPIAIVIYMIQKLHAYDPVKILNDAHDKTSQK